MNLTPDNLDNVGPMLATRRRLKGLTLEKLEDRCGIRASSINAIELGRTGARLSSLVLIADALGLEVVVREKEKTP